DVIAAAKRETEEETGLDTEKTRLVGVYESSLVMGGSVQCHIFEARIVRGELTVPDDMLDVRWFSLGEIRDLEEKGLLMFPYVLEAVERYVEGR
ncbi:NUDIX domain-containing protein, partial [Patescibacteria group bacterium]|nr:NUDIX domain-containing protein [Patescibacteria group bacterium]